MEELSKAQRARSAIAAFKTLTDALILTGSYQPSGTTGRKLEDALRQFSPEIYGSMSDQRVVELKGLEYVIDRLPRGIEECNKIVLTAQEDLEGTSFEEIRPLKRRRLSYVVSRKEICFVITKGPTEIYDILTHLTFMNIEAQKIRTQINRQGSEASLEWKSLQQIVDTEHLPDGPDLDQAIWNLSIILGRTYRETWETYQYLDQNRVKGFNNGLFRIVHRLGSRILNEEQGEDDRLTIYFTPSLQDILGHHRYASQWAVSLKKRLLAMDLQARPMHIVSANMHSFRNIFYGYGALQGIGITPADDLYQMIHQLREYHDDIERYAGPFGFSLHQDVSGSNIDVQIIDTGRLVEACVHPKVLLSWDYIKKVQPVILVMDYAFGAQAYEVMDELLSPLVLDGREWTLAIESISIMGKAGILPGKKGDIMLATAHVMEGTPHNYILENDLSKGDFHGDLDVFCGPMVTVLGTSLQNRDVLERFHSSSWRAIGIEMEGGHYQRAINAAIIQRRIPKNMKTRYAYYASDNPLVSGQTLASGPMGDEGIMPTYLISKVIVEKILRTDHVP
ncbi:MAG: hypothetical protein IH612_07620 [Desulfofustis sp.]|nr:hypothetical protein [Desulfofustis sp.]